MPTIAAECPKEPINNQPDIIKAKDLEGAIFEKQTEHGCFEGEIKSYHVDRVTDAGQASVHDLSKAQPETMIFEFFVCSLFADSEFLLTDDLYDIVQTAVAAETMRLDTLPSEEEIQRQSDIKQAKRFLSEIANDNRLLGKGPNPREMVAALMAVVDELEEGANPVDTGSVAFLKKLSSDLQNGTRYGFLPRHEYFRILDVVRQYAANQRPQAA